MNIILVENSNIEKGQEKGKTKKNQENKPGMKRDSIKANPTMKSTP
eukprot:CAMPEP_0170550366 /NCGR_PEP_ID=MMETSP0211-20121228/8425_1 /TAXON_ID=311385 /ORGANISM="Pseudokeronopsis sp., Strain OXSARD2" /LENGTH=45 /DNA_ID= /DNA_START= /DNA_END= /DNA_ORIENTATION=